MEGLVGVGEAKGIFSGTMGISLTNIASVQYRPMFSETSEIGGHADPETPHIAAQPGRAEPGIVLFGEVCFPQQVNLIVSFQTMVHPTAVSTEIELRTCGHHVHVRIKDIPVADVVPVRHRAGFEKVAGPNGKSLEPPEPAAG